MAITFDIDAQGRRRRRRLKGKQTAPGGHHSSKQGHIFPLTIFYYLSKSRTFSSIHFSVYLSADNSIIRYVIITLCYYIQLQLHIII